MKKFLMALICFSFVSISSVTTAGAHKDYKKCSWWEIGCESYHRYNTKYPIVLVHGFAGFDQILGVMSYFHQIPEELEGGFISGGNAKVYVAHVSPVNTTEFRGEELLEYIETHVLPDSGASKVHIFGHSHGGTTIRYVSGVRPDLVASINSVAGNNFGSGFADWALEIAPLGSAANKALELLFALTGTLINIVSGNDHEIDALHSALSLTSAAAEQYNARFPDGMPTEYCGEGPELVNGVRYYSWGGTGLLTNILDLTDPAMAAIGIASMDKPNDGLVDHCQTHWGNVIRDDYDFNHMDSVNLLFGLRGWNDPVAVYQNQAAKFRDMGL